MKESFTLEHQNKYLELLHSKYAAYIADRRFDIQFSDEGNHATLTVTLANAKETFFYPVELKVFKDHQKLGSSEAAILMLDFLECYFDDFFKEDEQVFLPIDWQEFEFGENKLFAKGQIINRHLENMADQLLGDGLDQILKN